MDLFILLSHFQISFSGTFFQFKWSCRHENRNQITIISSKRMDFYNSVLMKRFNKLWIKRNIRKLNVQQVQKEIPLTCLIITWNQKIISFKLNKTSLNIFLCNIDRGAIYCSKASLWIHTANAQTAYLRSLKWEKWKTEINGQTDRKTDRHTDQYFNMQKNRFSKLHKNLLKLTCIISKHNLFH